MSRYTLNLGNANWYFGQVPCRAFTDPNSYDLPAVAEWLPATVPGNVRTDLLALGRISDPFLGEQYKESLWVEDVDWWYRCVIEPPNENDTMRRRREGAGISLSFILPSSSLFSQESRAFLIFAGIDYLSAIFVNGREVTRHEGMFSRQIIEITAALREGPADIAVRLWGSSALPRRKLNWQQRLWQKIAAPLYRSWIGIYPDRSATLKCQMSFGWDFAPPIRTMGIWDEVSLIITGPVAILEVSASSYQSPVISHQLSVGSQHLSLVTDHCSLTTDHCSLTTDHCPLITVHCSLDADQPRHVAATIRVAPANFTGPEFGPFDFSLDLPAGPSEHRLTCHLPEAALWQPWDRGQPHLYKAQITLTQPDGEPLDEVTLRTGIRSIELRDWQFTINGPPEFMRGLNWVPADSFPGRLRPGHYARLLKMARESGANLLRVWGGGLREKRAFYDLCDELGLLVWQEFPFACMFLGSYPSDPAFLALVEAECGSIVRQLRHHPALALWCGGNEFGYSRNHPLLDTLAATVQQHDSTRPFLPVSPRGDVHNWDVWHGLAPLQTYQAETTPFLSEFGLQALPHLDTLQAALPDPTTGWSTHHADERKLERYGNLFALPDTLQLVCGAWCVVRNKIHVSRTTHHANLQSLISQSQRAQATALQTAIERMRRRKGQAGGVCLWQFNEPWPAISWAIVDYFGRPKLAYERLRDWYAPLLISLNFPVGRRWQAGDSFEADIWAVNDTLQALADCELQVCLDETLIQILRLDMPPDSSICIGRLTHRLVQPPGQISLGLVHEGELITQNRYDLSWFDESRQPILARFRRWVADWVLR
ncbi:MAG: hypothetical protein DPW09_39230 [Anaerolineae bacterium]|nr:hypothetical protein [Anaerolineales bacterium]MCQ3979490.1 hypothetical protein [Anaerolineae bacterium]